MVPHNPSYSSTLADIMMMSSQVMVATRSKYYGPKGPIANGNDASPSSQHSTSIPSPFEPLQIEKPKFDMVIWLPPKGVVWKSTFNPHARVVYNYKIGEDLSVSHQAMSALDIL